MVRGASSRVSDHEAPMSISRPRPSRRLLAQASQGEEIKSGNTQ